MKATDLRIGNFVNIHTRLGRELDTIKAIGERGANTVKHLDVPFENIEGITLSPEWLIKLGFLWNSNFNGYEKADWLPFHIEQRKNFFNKWFLTTFKQDWSIVQLSFVHELQNIYHSLKGEDLVFPFTKDEYLVDLMGNKNDSDLKLNG